MKKNKNIKIFIILLFFTSIIFIPKIAKNQELSLWKDLGLYGGQITCLAIDPLNSNIMYAGSWMGDGLFKTIDGGETWFSIPRNSTPWFRNLEVHDIAIDPNNSDIIWVANYYTVDVSRDGGETWQTFYFAWDEDRICYSVAVDPFDSDTIYVGTGGPDSTDEYGEVFITHTAGGPDGNDWHPQSRYFHDYKLVRGNFWQITFNPNKQGEAWFANDKQGNSSDGLVYMTPDGGQNWYNWSQARFEGSLTPFGFVDEVLVHPTNPSKIFLGTGEGVAYKPDGSNLTDWFWTTVNSDCKAICIPPAEKSTIYAGLPDAIAISKDNGSTWSDLPAPEFLAMRPHPTDPATIFAGEVNQGIFTTHDRAETWEKINQGIKANAIYDTAVDPATPSTILCASLAGVFLKNTTSQWKQVNTLLSKCVVFHPTNPAIIYAGSVWRIGKSTDKGASWTYLHTPDNESGNSVVSLAPVVSGANSAVIYAAVAYISGKKGQVLKIQDNGGSLESATSETILETNVPINAVAVNPQDPSFIIAAAGSFYAPPAPGGIYISRNGGQTWKKKFLPGRYTVNCIEFDPDNPDTIYLGCGLSSGTSPALLKSTDGGKTWKNKRAGLPRFFSVKDIKVVHGDSSIVYAALFNGYSFSREHLAGVYVSLDGGDYWSRVGLSDHYVYDVTLGYENLAIPSSTMNTKAATASKPIYTVYAGSGSGLLAEDPSTIAGMGIITGMITSTENDAPINEAYVNSTAGTGAQSNLGTYQMQCPSGQHSITVTAPGYLALSPQTIYVEAGKTYEVPLKMQPFDDNDTCIYSELLQTEQKKSSLQPLRDFRDSILKKTPAGRHIISQYYSLGKEVLPVIMGSAELKVRCMKLLARSSEIARSATAGKTLLLPAGFMDEAQAVLLDLEKKSPDELRNKIKELRCDMRHFKAAQLQPREDGMQKASAHPL